MRFGIEKINFLLRAYKIFSRLLYEFVQTTIPDFFWIIQLSFFGVCETSRNQVLELATKLAPRKIVF